VVPKGSCVESLVPSVAVLRDGGVFKRWGLVDGGQVTGTSLLKGINVVFTGSG
jgi:hypothetical protein